MCDNTECVPCITLGTGLGGMDHRHWPLIKFHKIPQTLGNTTAKTNSAVWHKIPQPVENYGPYWYPSSLMLSLNVPF